MKKLISTTALVLLLSNDAQSFELLIGGKRINELTAKDYGFIALGVVAEYGVHELGHIIALEALNADWSFEDNTFWLHNWYDYSDSQNQWVARAGFTAGTVVNAALYFTKWKGSSFHIGYSMAATMQPLFYPIDKSGDLNTLKRFGGNPKKEKLLFTTSNALLTIPLLQLVW